MKKRSIGIVVACVAAVALLVAADASAQAPAPASTAAVQAPVVTVKPYGYVKLDASYDSHRSVSGDMLFYVLPLEAGEKDDEFNMTAKETRLGFDLAGPDVRGFKTTGKIETDFYGSTSANSPSLRLRLGYLDLANPDMGFSVRAGQDWETFITVIPRIVNFGYLADCGALGLRRPQLRLKQDIGISSSANIVAMVAAARTIGEDIDGGGQDDGVDSGTPTVQGNIYLEAKLLTTRATKIGISGHFGQEIVDSVVSNVVVGSDDQTYDSWSIQGSIFLPIIEQVALQGNIWTGHNLDTYYGGIGQGINKTLKTEIAAKGGWVQALVDVTSDLNLNIGAGMDDPDDADLSKGNRAKNVIYFGSLFYKLSPAVTVAGEYSYLTTSYKEGDEVSNNRFHGAAYYKF